MGKPTVIIVDDENSLCETLTAALEGEGYRVLCALGFAAFDLAREERPDAILLDVLMHGLDGAQLSRLLRAHPSTAHIPIIAMSRRTQQDAPPTLVCDAWLDKPFDLSALYAAVDAATQPPAHMVAR